MGRRVALSSSTEPVGVELLTGWTLVQRDWASTGRWTPQSHARYLEFGERFVSRLTASGIRTWEQVDEAACVGFVHAPTRSGQPPRASTQRLRRATVRAVFRSLRRTGQISGDPTLDLILDPATAMTFRPLTDEEITLGRAASRLGAGTGMLLRAVAWALAEAGAASSEIGAIGVTDLDHPRTPTSVSLLASTRYAARTIALTDWGRVVLTRHLTDHPNPTGPLAYTGRGSSYGAQASVCASLGRVLDLAGLRSDPAVRPRSIRAWAGRRVYETTGDLTAVADLLGARRLDTAAAEIALEWTTQVGERP